MEEFSQLTHADKIIKNDLVDYVCRGEGEGAVVEMANALSSGSRIDQIKNLTLKGEGNIYKNGMRAPVDIDTVPIPDWDLFEKGSLYRPMQGKIWRAVGFETQRDAHTHVLSVIRHPTM